MFSVRLWRPPPPPHQKGTFNQSNGRKETYIIIISYFGVTFNAIILLLTSMLLSISIITINISRRTLIKCTTTLPSLLTCFIHIRLIIWIIICLLQKFNLKFRLLIFHPGDDMERLIDGPWYNYIITTFYLPENRLTNDTVALVLPCSL